MVQFKLNSEQARLLLNLVSARISFFENAKFATGNDEVRVSKKLELDRLFGDIALALSQETKK